MFFLAKESAMSEMPFESNSTARKMPSRVAADWGKLLKIMMPSNKDKTPDNKITQRALPFSLKASTMREMPAHNIMEPTTMVREIMPCRGFLRREAPSAISKMPNAMEITRDLVSLLPKMENSDVTPLKIKDQPASISTVSVAARGLAHAKQPPIKDNKPAINHSHQFFIFISNRKSVNSACAVWGKGARQPLKRPLKGLRPAQVLKQKK